MPLSVRVVMESQALNSVGARSVLGAGDRCEGDWGYQWCTEMVQPFSNDGLNDMFWPPSPFNLSAGRCCRLLAHGRVPAPVRYAVCAMPLYAVYSSSSLWM